MSQQTYNVKQTLFEDISQCANIGICSRRRAGKSTLMMHLIRMMFMHCGVRRFVVFCGNRDARAQYARVVHPLYIHGNDMAQLEAIIRYQENTVGHYREQWERDMAARQRHDPTFVIPEFETPNKMKLAIFIDDLAEDPAFLKSVAMRDMACNARHYGVFLCSAYQKLTKMIPVIRENMDYVAVLACNSDNMLKRLHSEYIWDTVVSLKHFKYLMTACTSKKGNCLWIKNDGSTTLQDKVFFGKFPYPIKLDPIGGRRYRDYARNHYLSRQRLEEEMRSTHSQVSFNIPQQDVTRISQSLDDDTELEEGSQIPDIWEGDSQGQAGESVVSLNRRSGIGLAKIREGHHLFNDVRGNVISINMLKKKNE